MHQDNFGEAVGMAKNYATQEARVEIDFDTNKNHLELLYQQLHIDHVQMFQHLHYTNLDPESLIHM